MCGMDTGCTGPGCIPPALRGKPCPDCGKPICACADIPSLIPLIRNETRALRPLIKLGIIKGLDIGGFNCLPQAVEHNATTATP